MTPLKLISLVKKLKRAQEDHVAQDIETSCLVRSLHSLLWSCAGQDLSCYVGCLGRPWGAFLWGPGTVLHRWLWNLVEYVHTCTEYTSWKLKFPWCGHPTAQASATKISSACHCQPHIPNLQILQSWVHCVSPAASLARMAKASCCRLWTLNHLESLNNP